MRNGIFDESFDVRLNFDELHSTSFTVLLSNPFGALSTFLIEEK